MAARSFLRWFPSVAAIVATGAITTAVRPFYAAGPPAARTGGFSETTCAECHRGEPLNAAGGSLSLDSLPRTGYQPGHTYELSVVVTKPGIGRAGFQLSVRADEASGKDKQAGTLAPLDDRTQFAAKNFSPIQYLEHTAKGTALLRPDTARWSFRWQAPKTNHPVVFHIAANAANDDNSELGDFIYTKAFHVISAR